MSERRLLGAGALGALAILATIIGVRLMQAPVDHMAQAVDFTLRARPADTDFFFETPWGLPPWVLIIDNAVGLLLLSIAFLGGLPLAMVALGLHLSSRPPGQRHSLVGRLAPYCLVFQVSSLCLASAITIIALLAGGAEPFLEPLTWYHVATVVASIVAIPVWRRRVQATMPPPAIFNERPA